MIKSLQIVRTDGDVTRKINELVDSVNAIGQSLKLLIDAGNLLNKELHKLSKVVGEHDQQLDMIVEMISQEIPSSELDS